MVPGDLKTPIQEFYAAQYAMTDAEREKNVDEFLVFAYSIVKTMLTVFPSPLPNQSGYLLTHLIPMDEATQRGVIDGSLVPKTGIPDQYVPYQRWDPVMTEWLRTVLDPVFQGAVALKEIRQPLQRTYRPLDLGRPQALELLARFQVGLPVGELPYGSRGTGYKIALRFAELFPSFLIQAIHESPVVPRLFQVLRGMEDMCYRRVNAQPQ